MNHSEPGLKRKELLNLNMGKNTISTSVIPEAVNIFGKEYRIKLVESYTRDDGMMGRCDTKKGEIILESNLSNDIMESTLMHEIIHVILDNLAFDFDEKVIAGLESGLYQVGYRLK